MITTPNVGAFCDRPYLTDRLRGISPAYETQTPLVRRRSATQSAVSVKAKQAHHCPRPAKTMTSVPASRYDYTAFAGFGQSS